MEDEKKQLSEKDKLYRTIRHLIYFLVGFFILILIVSFISMFLSPSAPNDFVYTMQ